MWLHVNLLFLLSKYTNFKPVVDIGVCATCLNLMSAVRCLYPRAGKHKLKL